MALQPTSNVSMIIGDQEVGLKLEKGTALMQDIKVASNVITLDRKVDMEGVYFAKLQHEGYTGYPILVLINFTFPGDQAEMMCFKTNGAPRAFEDFGLFGDSKIEVNSILRKFQKFSGDGVDLKTQLDKDIKQAKVIFEQSCQCFVTLPSAERVPVRLQPGTPLMQDIKVASNVVQFPNELDAEGVYWGELPGRDMLCLINFSFRSPKQGEMMTFKTNGAPRPFESFGLCGEVDINIAGVFREFKDFSGTSNKPVSLKDQLNADVNGVKQLYLERQEKAFNGMAQNKVEAAFAKKSEAPEEATKPLFKSMFNFGAVVDQDFSRFAEKIDNMTLLNPEPEQSAPAPVVQAEEDATKPEEEPVEEKPVEEAAEEVDADKVDGQQVAMEPATPVRPQASTNIE